MADVLANSIALITKFSTKGFDKVYKKEACSSRLDASVGMFQFTGVRTVKIARMVEGGLSNYNRNNSGDDRVSGDSPFGYQQSSMGLVWEEFTLSQDRAARYSIEYFDNEESGDLVVGTAVSRVSADVVVPEVDAYCFSQLAVLSRKVVKGALQTATHDGISVVMALKPFHTAEKWFDDEEVPEGRRIAYISTTYAEAIKNDTTEAVRFLQQADYEKNISFKVTKYNDMEIVIVPPRRFQTGFIAYNGGFRFGKDDVKVNLPTVTDTEANGVLTAVANPVAATESEPIDFILMDKEAATHVVKYQKVKILSGELALAATNLDGYAVYFRIYHDIFALENKRKAIYVHLGGFTNSTKAADVLRVVKNAANKITEVTYMPEDKLIALIATTRADLPAVGSAFTLASATDTVVSVGSTTTATKFIAVYGGVVSAVYTIA